MPTKTTSWSRLFHSLHPLHDMSSVPKRLINLISLSLSPSPSSPSLHPLQILIYPSPSPFPSPFPSPSPLPFPLPLPLSILCKYLYTYFTVSWSWLFYSLNSLNIYWSMPFRVFHQHQHISLVFHLRSWKNNPNRPVSQMWVLLRIVMN